MLIQKARIIGTVTENKMYTLLPQFRVRDEVWVCHGSQRPVSMMHKPTGKSYFLEMVQGLDGFAWPVELLELLPVYQVFDSKSGLCPAIAQGDEDLFSWLIAVNSQGAGSFLSSLVTAALVADSENYALLRPVLLRMKEKYPRYLSEGNEVPPSEPEEEDEYKGQVPRE